MAEKSLKVAKDYQKEIEHAFAVFGLTQKKFGERVGLSRSTISNFLNGKAIYKENFIIICEKLKLDWQKVVGLQEKKPQEIIGDSKKQNHDFDTIFKEILDCKESNFRQELKKFEEGVVKLKSHEEIDIARDKIVDNAKRYLFATEIINREKIGTTDNEESYLKKLCNKVETNKDFSIKRVFLIDKKEDIFIENFKQRLKNNEFKYPFNMKIKYLLKSKWEKINKKNYECFMKPIDFGIWDKELVWKYNLNDQSKIIEIFLYRNQEDVKKFERFYENTIYNKAEDLDEKTYYEMKKDYDKSKNNNSE